MKITRLLILVALFGFTCTVALADGTDPVFKLSGGGSSEVLTSDTFSFTVNTSNAVNGLVSFDFINMTGAVVNELDLLAPGTTVPTPAFPNGVSLSYTCDNSEPNPYFNACSPTTSTAGPTTIRFFCTDNSCAGIPFTTGVTGDCDGDGEFDSDDACRPIDNPLSDFVITVGVSDLPAGSTFTVQGTLVTPEPSTLIMLFAAGLGFLVLKRSGFAI